MFSLRSVITKCLQTSSSKKIFFLNSPLRCHFSQRVDLGDAVVSMSRLTSLVTRSDVSGITVEDSASTLCLQYSGLDTRSKHQFLKQISSHQADTDDDHTFKRIGQLKGGVKFLVDMRKDLLVLIKTINAKDAEFVELRSMNLTLKNLLSNWFSVGFLNLEQVTWNSPCSLVEKICDYEAVHPIVNWSDIKARVGHYRRCFVYTHPSMPGEPMVILHVALTAGDISDNVDKLVRGGDDDDPGWRHQLTEDKDKCSAAIFYSVTSTQAGLQGIELGTQLIKHAVIRLQSEFPGINTFSTLSPIPGFRSWLIMELSRGESNTLTDDERRSLETIFQDDVESGFMECLKSNSWMKNEIMRDALRPVLMRLCARYLYQEKRRNFALNSVANFHLRNGSCLWRINWLADSSRRGLINSCGIMVNYRYYLDQLETNSNNYLSHHTIAVDDQVLKLLK